jgi:hypothetical protein
MCEAYVVNQLTADKRRYTQLKLSGISKSWSNDNPTMVLLII